MLEVNNIIPPVEVCFLRGFFFPLCFPLMGWFLSVIIHMEEKVV